MNFVKAAHLRLLKKRPHWVHISTGRQALLTYTCVMFFYYFGDTIMSYMTPVLINSYVSSEVYLGLIIGASSLIGFVCDLLFSRFFAKKSYPFFAPMTFISALLFPVSLIFFPHVTPTFLFAMAVWGVYYEFARFSHFNFFHTFLHISEHAQAWGILQAFQAVALLSAPLFAMFFFDLNKFLPFWVAIGFFAVSLSGFYLLQLKWKKTELRPTKQIITRPKTFGQEIKIWLTLIKKVWPVYLFLLFMTLLDSSFWTIGSLLSEELRHESWLGSFLIPAYILPSLVVTLLASRIARPFGKKKIAFITSLIGSVILFGGGLMAQGNAFVVVVLCSSLFTAVAFPEIYAVFEDYVARLGNFGNDMVGVEGSAISLGYIAGPVLSGILAAQLGNQTAIVCLAGLFGLAALVSLLIVPRKIKMPQQELLEITINPKR